MVNLSSSVTKTSGLFLFLLEYDCRVAINDESPGADFKEQSREGTQVLGEIVADFVIRVYDDFTHFEVTLP